jgi:O-antigen/teichoic acid export membrane protein
MVLFMIFSVQLFRFVLGNNWEAAGLIASILAIQYVFKFCEQCITYCLVVLGKQKINFVVSVIKLALIGTSIFIGIIFFNNILSTIVCFAIGSTIVQILMISVDFYYLGIRFSKFFLPLFLFAASAVTLIYPES